MRTSSRGQVDPFIVMDVLARAAELERSGRRIVHMEVGQPGTGAPRAALERLSADMAAGPLGYTEALGLPELRARIAALYGERHGLDLDPGRVVVTLGASGAFLLSFTALFDSGARVGLGEPCYPSYRQILSALGMVPVGVETTLENRFQPVPGDVAAHDLAGLIVASPANPTGTMLDRDALSGLAAACRSAGAALISDEIYHGVTYDRAPVSALEVTDEVHVINSFSKYWSMTGWRVGWLVVPEDHVRVVERLAQNMVICAPHAAQRLALHAMDCPEELEAMRAVYARNRDLMVAGLADAGFSSVAPPDGAFYVYADVSAFTDDAQALAAEILEEAGVAVTPGVDFDKRRGQHWLRFSYARGTDEIAEGLDRLRRFMASRGWA